MGRRSDPIRERMAQAPHAASTASHPHPGAAYSRTGGRRARCTFDSMPVVARPWSGSRCHPMLSPEHAVIDLCHGTCGGGDRGEHDDPIGLARVIIPTGGLGWECRHSGTVGDERTTSLGGCQWPQRSGLDRAARPDRRSAASARQEPPSSARLRIVPLRTEALMTAAASTSRLSATRTRHHTVAMDFGRIRTRLLVLYLFGSPARTGSGSCGATWPRRQRRPSAGGHPRLQACFAVDFFEARGLPSCGITAF